MTSFLVTVARRLPLIPRLLDVLAPDRSAATVTRRNTREAYETVYDSDRLLAGYLSPERKAFYDELAAILAPLQPQSVIDVGCGTGDLLRLLVDRLTPPPERIVGIDHAEAGIRRARQLMPGAEWLVDDLYAPSLGGEVFDLVVCTEVLEHLDDPNRAVATLCSLCATGGTVAITVPDGAVDSWEGHVNFWSEDELRVLLEPSGLDRIDRIDRGVTLLAWLSQLALTRVRRRVARPRERCLTTGARGARTRGRPHRGDHVAPDHRREWRPSPRSRLHLPAPEARFSTVQMQADVRPWEHDRLARGEELRQLRGKPVVVERPRNAGLDEDVGRPEQLGTRRRLIQPRSRIPLPS